MSDTAIVTRFHYPEDSKKFEWRFQFYAKAVLPLLLVQEDQDFDIAIWCNPWHEDRIRSLSPRIKTFSATHHPPKRTRGFNDFTRWDNVSGMEKYRIQINLDSDDLAGPEYVKIVHACCAGYESVFVGFNPFIIDMKSGRVGFLGPYTDSFTPAFFALCQREEDEYVFAYHDSHTRMWQQAERTILVSHGHCCATAHDMNASTGWGMRNRKLPDVDMAKVPWLQRWALQHVPRGQEG